VWHEHGRSGARGDGHEERWVRPISGRGDCAILSISEAVRDAEGCDGLRRNA